MKYNPVCSNCPAKSGDCAYGDLRGGQSCIDNLNRHLPKKTVDSK